MGPRHTAGSSSFNSRGRKTPRKAHGIYRDHSVCHRLCHRALQAPPDAHPLNQKKPRRDGASSWWAWVELNHRPHAYQACAPGFIGAASL